MMDGFTLAMNVLAQVSVTDTGVSMQIQITGWMLLLLALFVGGWIGWWHGYRAFLTVTLVSALAYVLFVSGGAQLLGIINNFWSNMPRIFALFTGGDPVAAGTWPPLIPGGGFQIPLGIRVMIFVVVVALAYRFNHRQPWYSNNTKEPYSREVGAFTGVLTALIWIAAATTFWVTYVNQQGTLQGLFAPLNSLLGVLPDVSGYVLPLIGGLMLFLVAGMALRFPKLLKP